MSYRKSRPRRKVCYFKQNKITEIDYKNVELLKRFVTPNGKLLRVELLEHLQSINVNLQSQLKTHALWDYFHIT